jgi:hypothetical protein
MPSDKDDERNKLIHNLATRLPWIVVLCVLLTAIVTIIEVYFFHK